MPLLSSNGGRLVEDDDEKVKAALGRLIASLSGEKKNLWESYNEMATGVDAIRELEYGDLADTVLVFAGLFAAFLSAFLLFMVTQLQPDNMEISKNILLHMSRQLNGSASAAFEEESFEVTSSAAKINILFFMSLALVLVDAFFAMLVKGWLRDFDRETRFSNVPEEKAKQRERRLQGIERWKLGAIVALLPLLIQIALVLFCVGLILFLWDLHRPTADATLAILVVGLLFYVGATTIATFDAYAPYASPISRGFAPAILWCYISLARPVHHAYGFVSKCFSRWSQHNHLEQSPAQELLGQRLVKVKPPLASFDYDRPRTRLEMHREFHEHRRDGQAHQLHLDVSHRLVSSTSKALENILIFVELFDQQLRFPYIRICNFTPWYEIRHLMHIILLDPLHIDDATMISICRISISLRAVGGERADGVEREVRDLAGKTHDALRKRTHRATPVESFYKHLLLMAHFGNDWVDSGLDGLDNEDATLSELLWSVEAYPLFVQHKLERDAPKFLISVAIYLVKGFSDKPTCRALVSSVLLAARSLRLRQEGKLELAVSGMELIGLHDAQSFKGNIFKLVDECSVPEDATRLFIEQLFKHWVEIGEFEASAKLLAVLLALITAVYPYHGIRQSFNFIRQQQIPFLLLEIWSLRTQIGRQCALQLVCALVTFQRFRSHSEKQCMERIQPVLNELVSKHISRGSKHPSGIDVAVMQRDESAMDEEGGEYSASMLWHILHLANILELAMPITQEALSFMAWIPKVSD